MTRQLTSKAALRLTDRFQDALSLLRLHKLVSYGERDKVRKRLDKWAMKHGLGVTR